MIKKALNIITLLSGYFLSRITRKVYSWGLPVSASFEPANTCNLHCPECPTGLHGLTRPAGKADIRLFRSFIDRAAGHLHYLTLYFQGEPYLHEGFYEMAAYARQKGIYVATSTNGHFLTPDNAVKTVRSGLNRIIISLDGTGQKSYSAYRIGGNYEKVIQGIKNIVEAKAKENSKKPFVVIQFLVLKTNEHQIPEIKKLYRELGADKLELKTAQFYNYEHGNSFMPENRKFSRYRLLRPKKTGIRNDTSQHLNTSTSQHLNTSTPQHLDISTSQPLNNPPTHQLANSLPRHCWRMWSSCVITWDGKVVPCCYDKDAAYELGDLREHSLRDIWKSERYDNFRRRILVEREKVDICCNCTEGMGASRIL